MISILFYNASPIRKIDMKESLLVGWCESHISMKCERYMTFTPRHQQIFIEIQYFRYFFKQCGPAVTLTSKEQASLLCLVAPSTWYCELYTRLYKDMRSVLARPGFNYWDSITIRSHNVIFLTNSYTSLQCSLVGHNHLQKPNITVRRSLDDCEYYLCTMYSIIQYVAWDAGNTWHQATHTHLELMQGQTK